MRAAALALEAAGHRPAGGDADGYRVRATPQPEAVAVYAPDPETLAACAATLEGGGLADGRVHRAPDQSPVSAGLAAPGVTGVPRSVDRRFAHEKGKQWPSRFPSA